MRGSSEKRAIPFDGLRRDQILVLLDLLQNSEVVEREYIKRRYLERAPRFETTLHFLTSIGTVDEKERHLSIAPAFLAGAKQAHVEDVAWLVLHWAFDKKTSFQAALISYLKRFHIVEGRAVYRPSEASNNAESGVRNFLMELGVVARSEKNGEYILSPQHYVLYARALHPSRAISPEALQRIQEGKESLGYSAEMAVISYEKERLGARLASRVDHVASRNAAAGYDIDSVTVCASGEVVPRYIEVKAVPRGTYQFYWTSNEIGVAEALGLWYYLYLLPVGKDGVFNLDALRIIQDPHSDVFGSASEWDTESDVVKCTMAAEPRPHCGS